MDTIAKSTEMCAKSAAHELAETARFGWERLEAKEAMGNGRILPAKSSFELDKKRSPNSAPSPVEKSAQRPLRSDKALQTQLPEEAAALSRLTILNTKRNAQYKQVDLIIEVVHRSGKRPPSPSAKFAKGVRRRRGVEDISGPVGEGSAVHEGSDEGLEERTRRRVQWSKEVGFVDDCRFTHRRTLPPAGSCLKPSPETACVEPLPAHKDVVTVQKVVYKDDAGYNGRRSKHSK